MEILDQQNGNLRFLTLLHIGDIMRRNGACPGVHPLERTFGKVTGQFFQNKMALRIESRFTMPTINSIITIYSVDTTLVQRKVCWNKSNKYSMKRNRTRIRSLVLLLFAQSILDVMRLVGIPVGAKGSHTTGFQIWIVTYAHFPLEHATGHSVSSVRC